MFRKTDLRHRFCREISAVSKSLPRIILSMIASAVLLFFAWTKFGGPCRIALLFHIPGGGVTIAAYYVLWFIMFALLGGEVSVICSSGDREYNRILLYHVASHLCLFLWYPLFFTTFSPLFALIVLAAATVTLILELKDMLYCSLIMSASILFKIIVTLFFIWINIAFMITN